MAGGLCGVTEASLPASSVVRPAEVRYNQLRGIPLVQAAGDPRAVQKLDVELRRRGQGRKNHQWQDSVIR